MPLLRKHPLQQLLHRQPLHQQRLHRQRLLRQRLLRQPLPRQRLVWQPTMRMSSRTSLRASLRTVMTAALMTVAPMTAATEAQDDIEEKSSATLRPRAHGTGLYRIGFTMIKRSQWAGKPAAIESSRCGQDRPVAALEGCQNRHYIHVGLDGSSDGLGQFRIPN
jgi:hypothetical protein